MEEDNVAFLLVSVGEVGRESAGREVSEHVLLRGNGDLQFSDETSIDFDQSGCPDLADVMN